MRLDHRKICSAILTLTTIPVKYSLNWSPKRRSSAHSVNKALFSSSREKERRKGRKEERTLSNAIICKRITLHCITNGRRRRREGQSYTLSCYYHAKLEMQFTWWSQTNWKCMRSFTDFNLLPLRSNRGTARIPGLSSETGKQVCPPKPSFSRVLYLWTLIRSNASSGTLNPKENSSFQTGVQSSIFFVFFDTVSAGTPTISTCKLIHQFLHSKFLLVFYKCSPILKSI